MGNIDTRMYITMLIIVGGFILVGLDKMPVDVLIALVSGALLPSPVVRDITTNDEGVDYE